MEMAAARCVGAGRKSLPDPLDTYGRSDFFWQWRRQFADSPLRCAQFGKSDGRPSRVEIHLHSMAVARNHAEGLGNSRAGTGGNRASLCRRRSAGGVAHRLFLGPQGFVERFAGAEAAGPYTRREKRFEQRSRAAKRVQQETGARNAVRSAYPAVATAEWLDPIQRCENAAGGGRRQPAAGAGREPVGKRTDVLRHNRLAIDGVHRETVPALAGERVGEVHAAAGWLHGGAGNFERREVARRCSSRDARLYEADMELSIPRMVQAAGSA